MAVASGAVGIGRCAAHDEGDYSEFAEAERPVDFLARVGAENDIAGRARESVGRKTGRKPRTEALLGEGIIALVEFQRRAAGVAEVCELIVGEAVADAFVGDLGKAGDVELLLLAVRVGDESRGVALGEESEDLGVVLALGVKLGIVGQGSVELGLIIFFEKAGIGEIADAELHLPVVAQELLVFPEESAAEFGGGIHIVRSPPSWSMPLSVMMKDLKSPWIQGWSESVMKPPCISVEPAADAALGVVIRRGKRYRVPSVAPGRGFRTVPTLL